jgi:S-adenosylmethionine/arginine decarboxylase-like enzyme
MFRESSIKNTRHGFLHSLLFELSGVDPRLLKLEDNLRSIILQVLKTMECELIAESWIDFNDGIAGTWMLKEAHIFVHTWPDLRCNCSCAWSL